MDTNNNKYFNYVSILLAGLMGINLVIGSIVYIKNKKDLDHIEDKLRRYMFNESLIF